MHLHRICVLCHFKLHCCPTVFFNLPVCAYVMVIFPPIVV